MRILSLPARLAPAYGPHYGLSSHLLLRGLGLVYVLAFWSLASQAGALIGPHGLTPIGQVMDWARGSLGDNAWLRMPTLFWISAGDGMLYGVLALGAAGGLLMLLGYLPWWGNLFAWMAQVSLMHVAHPWLGYQWDALLAEVGFVAFFFCSPRWRSMPDPSRMARQTLGVLMANALFFKLMFSSGWVKLASGDPLWQASTALHVHFETQPLPTVLAWFVHHLPETLLRYGLWGALFIELALPFYIFLPRVFRLIAAGGVALLMLLIHVSGNYGIFNLLTLLLCLPLIDDRAWRTYLPQGVGPKLPETSPRPSGPRPRVLVAGLWLLLWLPVCFGQIWIRDPGKFLPPWRGVAKTLSTFRSANGYGLFAVMTPQRLELEIQGSMDGKEWREYHCKYKPGYLNVRPRYAGFHMPRLDWQLWFAALRSGDPQALLKEPWLLALSDRLMRNDPYALTLLAGNPFPDAPPNFLRIAVFRYRFADPVTRREHKVWWMRQYRGLYGPVLQRGPENQSSL